MTHWAQGSNLFSITLTHPSPEFQLTRDPHALDCKLLHPVNQ